MTREQYIKITEPLRQSPEKMKCVVWANRILTGFVYIVYPLYVAVLFVMGKPEFLKAVLVPAVSFVLVSVFRKLINAPRPYEKFDIPPVIEKDTKGKSFPSRHVFSVFIIAMTIFQSYPIVGILLGLIGVAMAAIRVLGGVHEVRDVVAGALGGVVCGMVGFYIL